MKIGIGVTTYNRPKHLELWINQIKKYINYSCDIYIADDATGEGKLTCYDKEKNISTFVSSKDKAYKRKGIAERKNECLRHLSDCDYIFLFDDDCFPIKAGWAGLFIESSKVSGQQHFMYLCETPTIKKIGQNMSINIYNNCAGCFIFLTKEVIEKVGGYGTYGIYGAEHAGYTERIHAAGLTPLGKYTCPAGVDEYIYPMDYRFDKSFNRQVNHEPSLKNELHKVESYIKEGFQYFQEDIKQIYRPLTKESPLL